MTKVLQRKISHKIRKLRHEGYSAKQAAAIAYSMLRDRKKNPTEIPIINNTDLSWKRLLVLYDKELSTLKSSDIDHVVFEPEKMTVWGKGKKILEVDDAKKNPTLENLFESYLEIPNPKRKRNPSDFAERDLSSILAFMLYLESHPYMYKNVPDRLMTKLIEQGLFDEKKLCLTDKGEKFLEEARKARKNPRNWKERRFFDYILNHGFRTIKSLEKKQQIILNAIKYASTSATDVKHLAILGKRVLTEGIREA